MTDRVQPSLDADAQARYTAGAITRAGGSHEGWVVPAANDPGNLAADEPDITEADLNAFAETSSGSSFDVTIDPGAAFVGGAWLARDVNTTVTLASSTNGQSVYVGWDVSKSNTVIIGKSGDFDADDPKHEIWTFDTDGSGVTSSTDQRNLDDYRVRNEDQQFTQNLTGDEVVNQYPFGRGDIVTEAKVPSGAIMIHTDDGSGLPAGYVHCDGNNGTPDLRDRYVKGGTGNNEGTTGGTNSVTLSNSEMPSHDHTLSAAETNAGYNSDAIPLMHENTTTDVTDSAPIGGSGGSSAHQNEPAFYQLRYMMKT